MAEIPTFRKAEVAPSGQQPGYLQVNYDPEAFGAGIGRAFQQLGGDMQNVGAVINHIQDQKAANDVLQKVESAKNDLRPYLFDPNTGIYATKGSQAMGANDQVNAKLDEIKKNYIDGITDPRERELFTKLWGREEEQTKDKTALHVMNEMGNYKVETAKVALSGAITDAYNYYNDPKAIAKAIDDAGKAIDVNAAGLSPEAIAAAKTEAKSQITLAAISRWASEDPNKALDFYEQNKDALSGKDHIVATQLVNTAKDARDAQYNVNFIKAGGDYSSSQLFNRLVQAESSGDPGAISPKGAAGLAQVMPGTARDLMVQLGIPGSAQLTDKQITEKLTTDQTLNLKLGQLYLSQQLTRYHGDVEAALVAYNAGPASADAWLTANAGKGPGQRSYDVKGYPKLASETQSYVKKILGDGTGSIYGPPPGSRMTDSNWQLKHFTPDDLMAPTAGGRFVDAHAALALDALYEKMQARFPGMNISVNLKEGQAPGTQGRRRGTADINDNPHVKHSQHLYGKAFDVQWQGWSDDQKAAFITEARQLGFRGFGFYGPNGHIHIDRGRERTWGAVPAFARDAMATPIASNSTPAGGYAPQVAQAQTGISSDALPNSSTGFYGLGASSTPGAFAPTKSPNINAWMAQADQIPDPGLRGRTKAQLQIEAAQDEAITKANVAKLKQQAWDAVLNGGSAMKLPKELLAQLEPSFVSELNTFEKNRATGTFPMDWKAWSQVSGMSNQELTQIDPYTEYRNKLDNEHFDRLLTAVKEAQKAVNGGEHDKALLANMRSTSQIVDDVAAAQGWSKTSASDSAYRATFAAKLDAQIAAEQQLKGKELSAVEIQDIADKLLIKGVTSKGYVYDSKDNAFNVKDPNTFIAASSWDSVQPDDQKTLLDYYQSQFKTNPDQETATDLYNRAMRVYLGGRPDGPDPEKKQLRDAVESRLGRKLTDTQFENIYGKYLLKFLGR